MRSRWLILLLSLAAAAGAADTAAPRTLYRLEALILRYSSPTSNGEDYRAAPEGRGFEFNTRSPGAAPALVKVLDAADLRMTVLARQLAASPGISVLAHAGWIQTPSVYRHHVGIPLEQLGSNVPDLSGAVFLERGELLHLGVQLQWNSGGVSYSLSELRDKVRFNERHYLDNPAFGVIIEVSPVRQ